jgi:hypothetical protein
MRAVQMVRPMICSAVVTTIALAASCFQTIVMAQTTQADSPIGSYSCGSVGRFDDFFGFDLQLNDSSDNTRAQQAVDRLLGGQPVKARMKVLGRPSGLRQDDVVFDAVVVVRLRSDRRSFDLSKDGQSIFRLRPPRPRELKPRTPGLIAIDADIVMERSSRSSLGTDFPVFAAVVCVAVQ